MSSGVQQDGFKTADTNERIRCILREVSGSRILHVGCVCYKVPETSAEKKHSLHFQLCQRLNECEVLGLDIDAAGVAEMNKRGFRAIVGDAQAMQFESCFDTIVAGELIEHLASPGLFLEGCARALKPDGKLVLSTPNPFSTMYLLMYVKNYDRAFYPEHALWLCPQTIREMVRRSGLSVTKLCFVDDLEPEMTSSVPYKCFAFGWKGLRVFLPKRFRSTMIVVCERAGNLRQPTHALANRTSFA